MTGTGRELIYESANTGKVTWQPGVTRTTKPAPFEALVYHLTIKFDFWQITLYKSQAQEPA